MYFSRIQLNRELRKTKAALASPHLVHGMMTKSVPPDSQVTDDGRVLWRIDHGSNGFVLYAVTPVEPRFDHVVEQLGWPSAPAETTDYGRLLDSLQRGQRYAFRAALNPVKKKGSKRYPHVSVKHQLKWFFDRTAAWGFSIPEGTGPGLPSLSPDSSETADRRLENVTIVRREDQRFTKPTTSSGKNRVVHRSAVFEGVLEVADAELLRNALTFGMGSGKAHGCGLMTLSRQAFR